MKNTNYHKAKFWVGIKLLSTDSKSYKLKEAISVMAGLEDIKESKDFHYIGIVKNFERWKERKKVVSIYGYLYK